MFQVVAALFAPLKAQNHPARQLRFVLTQDLGGSEQHGGVGVMSAGVGHAGHLGDGAALGLLGIVRGLLHGQRVHVAPQQDRAAPVLVTQKAQDAAVFHFHVGNAELFQLLTQEAQGLKFLSAELRMLVQIVAQGDHQGFVFLGKLQNIHDTLPPFLRRPSSRPRPEHPKIRTSEPSVPASAVRRT